MARFSLGRSTVPLLLATPVVAALELDALVIEPVWNVVLVTNPFQTFQSICIVRFRELEA